MNNDFTQSLFLIFITEIAVSCFNHFIMVKKVYESRLTELRAHQIGMMTRIIYIFAFAYALDHFGKIKTINEFLLAGVLWVFLIEIFEWIGSYLLGRSVKEILMGWHIEKGYMWPFVLLAYLVSPIIMGIVFIK